MSDPGPQAATQLSSAQRSTAILINEDEIATLPNWQQELLSDSGWNQPYITPRAKTEIEPPAPEMLLEDYQRVREAGVRYGARGMVTGKSASWFGGGGFEEPVVKGQYCLQPRDADPPYGCITDGLNGSGDYALEDVILAGTHHLPYAITFVLQGASEANHFNTTGGMGNIAQSAVLQLFSSAREGTPEDWDDQTNNPET